MSDGARKNTEDVLPVVSKFITQMEARGFVGSMSPQIVNGERGLRVLITKGNVAVQVFTNESQPDPNWTNSKPRVELGYTNEDMPRFTKFFANAEQLQKVLDEVAEKVRSI